MLNSSNNAKYGCRIAAFSLLELLFAMVISAIILSLAINTYDRYQIKIQYLDGRNKLLEIMQKQHHHFAEHLTFTDQLESLGFSSIDHAVLSDHQHFRIRAAPCQTVIAQCVRLTATATDPTNDVDTLTLDSMGRRTPADIW